MREHGYRRVDPKRGASHTYFYTDKPGTIVLKGPDSFNIPIPIQDRSFGDIEGKSSKEIGMTALRKFIIDQVGLENMQGFIDAQSYDVNPFAAFTDVEWKSALSLLRGLTMEEAQSKFGMTYKSVDNARGRVYSKVLDRKRKNKESMVPDYISGLLLDIAQEAISNNIPADSIVKSFRTHFHRLNQDNQLNGTE
jgi:hypothetical protein